MILVSASLFYGASWVHCQFARVGRVRHYPCGSQCFLGPRKLTWQASR